VDDFGDVLRLIVMVLVIAASVLGPLVERWRRKKEEERLRRKAEERGEAAPAPAPEPAAAPAPEQEPTLPYEDLVQEVFGPYIERRKKAAEEARQAAEERAAAGEIEGDEEHARLDREIRTLREARRPEPDAVAVPAAEEPVASIAQLRAGAGEPVPTAAARARRGPSLDERLFRNARLSPGAKLVLASEILGRPKSQRR
jgi:hypothetical protein